MSPTGKTAVVFGGTSGIGLATVERLAQAGARVIAVSRNPERAKDQVPAGVELAACDTTDAQAVADLCAGVAPIDFLINCATGGERALGPFMKMDMAGYQGSFAKLWGYANTVRYGGEHLSADASVVLVTGSPAQRAKPGQAALASVGGAVEAFVRALAPELAPRRINAVSPGMTNTPMFGPDSEDKQKLMVNATANHLLKRAIEPGEVADAIMLVATNEMMTGGAINVDGGWILA